MKGKGDFSDSTFILPPWCSLNCSLGFLDLHILGQTSQFLMIFYRRWGGGRRVFPYALISCTLAELVILTMLRHKIPENSARRPEWKLLALLLLLFLNLKKGKMDWETSRECFFLSPSCLWLSRFLGWCSQAYPKGLEGACCPKRGGIEKSRHHRELLHLFLYSDIPNFTSLYVFQCYPSLPVLSKYHNE